MMKKGWNAKNRGFFLLLAIMVFWVLPLYAGAAESGTATEAAEATELVTSLVNSGSKAAGVSLDGFLAGKQLLEELKKTADESYEMTRPVLLKAHTKTNTSVKLVWESVEHAQGYVIYRKMGSGKWKKIKTLAGTTKLSYIDKNLKTGKTYRYRIRAYRIDGMDIVYSKYSRTMKVRMKKPQVPGDYEKGSVYAPASTKKQLAQIRRVVQSFKDNYIRAGMSDWEKALAVFQYVRNTCDYTWENWTLKKAGSAWGALVLGKAHCGGYSRAVKALCDGIGLECYYVHANENSANPTHRWNLVKIDGTWYVLDTKDGVFLAGTNTFCKKRGMTWNTKGLPVCSETDHEKSFVTTKEG